MRKIFYIFLAATFMFAFSCKKQINQSVSGVTPTANSAQLNSHNKLLSLLSENFETGTKTAYASANVTLTSGVWSFNDALIGNATGDAKNGTQSARIRNSGKISMQFDKTGGAGTVTVYHARYGSDATGTWQLWYSTNSGSSYLQAGSNITSSTNTLAVEIFTLNLDGNVRIDIRKSDGGTNRINIDDISITDYSSGNNPVPTTTSISPVSVLAGSGSFTLTVTGSNFISSSVVQWNATNFSTTFVSASQITATISAANVASAGSAVVTVFNPAPGGGTSNNSTFTITAPSTSKKFLFDAKHAETAANADWVIDEDASPQRFPTPLQNTVTSTTAENYWTGALSSWGIALVKAAQNVETLPASGAITYGNSGNAQDLSNYNVFVVDEPNTVFTAAEKTAILLFVQNGGGLLMISDHTISDRNGDGWDSPAIWNDLMTNNSVQNNPFGFSIDLNKFSGTSSNVLNNLSNVILHGSQGNVLQLSFNGGTSVTLNPAVNVTVEGVIWRSGYTQNNINVLCATSTFGTGRVFIIGDSSPEDDGTGAAGNTLFASWNSYSHKQLMMNASMWLAKLQ